MSSFHALVVQFLPRLGRLHALGIQDVFAVEKVPDVEQPRHTVDMVADGIGPDHSWGIVLLLRGREDAVKRLSPVGRRPLRLPDHVRVEDVDRAVMRREQRHHLVVAVVRFPWRLGDVLGGNARVRGVELRHAVLLGVVEGSGIIAETHIRERDATGRLGTAGRQVQAGPCQGQSSANLCARAKEIAPRHSAGFTLAHTIVLQC